MKSLEVSEDCWRTLIEAKLSGKSLDGKALAGLGEGAHDLFGPLLRYGASPFVIAQIGQSLDGRVATLSGDARDISGSDGLTHLHRLRALMDAVLVGVGTVAADDPQLTVREVDGPSPVRVIIDPNGRMPEEALVLSCREAKTLIIRASGSGSSSKSDAIIEVDADGQGRLSPHAILDALAARGLTRILVEGGGKTIGAFLEAGRVDRLHVAVSPILIGSGLSSINLLPIDRLAEAKRPPFAIYDLGSDILFDLDLAPSR